MSLPDEFKSYKWVMVFGVLSIVVGLFVLSSIGYEIKYENELKTWFGMIVAGALTAIGFIMRGSNSLSNNRQP